MSKKKYRLVIAASPQRLSWARKGSKRFTMFLAEPAHGSTAALRWSAPNSIVFDRKEVHHGKAGTSQGATT
jgi:hypothetical protein